MTDALTEEIRRAVAELVDAAPVAPDFEVLPGPPSRRPAYALVVATAVVLLVVGGLGLLRRDASTVVSVGQRSSAPGGGGASTGIPAAVPGEPTFVAPSTLPQGLRLIEGGTGDSTTVAVNTILVAGPDGATARLSWSVDAGGACVSAPWPRGEPSVESGSAVERLDRVPSTPADSPFTPSRDGSRLNWCAEGRFFTFTAMGLSEDSARGIAASARVVPGRLDDVTIVPPSGFVAGAPKAVGQAHVLVFRPHENTSARPQLGMRVRSAWTTDLRLLKAELGVPTATDVDVGGRPGFIKEMPAGPRYYNLTVVYDDRTLVHLSGDGLSLAEMLSLAASLTPADRSMAPDVTSDPQRCKRLALCR